MDMTRIEINGHAYEEAIIDDHNDLGLFFEGVLIAKTRGTYCLVNADGSARIEDVKKWITTTKAYYIAHTTRI